MGKDIDIGNYNDFINKGFKECPKCGWAFDPQFFDNHECPPKDTGNKLPKLSLENDKKIN